MSDAAAAAPMELIGFNRDRYDAVVQSVPTGRRSAVATYDLDLDLPIRPHLLRDLLREAERRGDVICAGDHENPLVTVSEEWQGLRWYRPSAR